MGTIFQQHCLLRISKWVNTILLWEDGRQSPKMLSSKYRPRPRERLLMLVHGRCPACSSQGVHSCTHMHAGKHTEPRYMKYEAVGLFLQAAQRTSRTTHKHWTHLESRLEMPLISERQTVLSQFWAIKREDTKQACIIFFMPEAEKTL